MKSPFAVVLTVRSRFRAVLALADLSDIAVPRRLVGRLVCYVCQVPKLLAAHGGSLSARQQQALQPECAICNQCALVAASVRCCYCTGEQVLSNGAKGMITQLRSHMYQ